MDMSRVALVEGFYEDSLTQDLRSQHDFKPVSVVLLDCDYYSSTVEALAWIQPYLNDGCILLFDDWFSYGDDDQLGQPKAFEEFLEKHTEFEAAHLWRFSHNGNAYRLSVNAG
jgi:O-methyltransferase